MVFFLPQAPLSNLSRSTVCCDGIGPRLKFHWHFMMVLPKDLRQCAKANDKLQSGFTQWGTTPFVGYRLCNLRWFLGTYNFLCLFLCFISLWPCGIEVGKDELLHLMWPYASLEDTDHMCTVFDHCRWGSQVAPGHGGHGYLYHSYTIPRGWTLIYQLCWREPQGYKVSWPTPRRGELTGTILA